MYVGSPTPHSPTRNLHLSPFIYIYTYIHIPKDIPCKTPSNFATSSHIREHSKLLHMRVDEEKQW